MTNLPPLAGCLLGFLTGSIPFGFLIGKAYGVDPREKGSGNIGATNVLRVLGKGPGTAVFLLDVLKGYLPVAVGHTAHWAPHWLVAAGLSAVLGHIYSPFVRFKGGKGVATTLGVLFGLSPLVAVLSFGVFLLTVALTNYISVGSIVAALTQATLFWVFPFPLPQRIFGVVVALFVVLRHRANIQRLRRGEENPFRKKKDPTEPA